MQKVILKQVILLNLVSLIFTYFELHPKEIVVSKQKGNYVFVVEKGIAYEREIQIGLENPKQVQVVSGLKVGENVVVKGYETLRNESKIKVVK